MKEIKNGIRHKQVFYPRPEQLASALGNHGVDVVATTALILYFEEASNNLVSPYYEDDEVSVGTHVNVDHLAPVYGDEAVEVAATLTLQKGRRLEFDLVAKQGETVVMQGKHYRAVMSEGRFSDRKTKSANCDKQINFWFDFHSPWCYFASHQIGDIAREFGATLNWKPVHLANLSAAIDGRRPLEANKPFVYWYIQDQHDTAALCGLPFEPHTDYPLRPSRALRAAIYASENGLAEPFVKRLMCGYWSEQCDISDMDWVCGVAKDVGLDSEKIRKAMTADAYKQKLDENLQTAIESNLFGLPACVVDGKIFWGNDRLDLLRHYLSNEAPRLTTASDES